MEISDLHICQKAKEIDTNGFTYLGVTELDKIKEIKMKEKIGWGV